MTRKHITVPPPVAGFVVFGLKPYGSYKATQRGDIPVIKIGNRQHVSVVWMEQVAGVGPGELDDKIDATLLDVKAAKRASRKKED